ncbi:MAG TPA: TonB family protein [Pyrinomonadaceae bacterium]
MHSFRFAIRLQVVALTLAVLSVASAQSLKNTTDWETLRPEGEQFSVLMPKGSTFESSKEPYHKMELNTRMYLYSRPGGPVFAVVSLSGIKSNPALYTEMQRINSYVDAFKNLFAPKVRKDAVAKLTLVGEKSLQGNPGREYRITIAELTGTAQVFATRKRFYSIVYLNTKKDEAIQEQFLSSFVLPERIEGPPERVPAETGNGVGNSSVAEAQASKPASNDDPDAARKEEPKPTTAAAPTDPTVRGPISGGVLNGKALSLPAPEYPAAARQAKASGAVAVQVTVDESGSVIAAHAVSGHPLLQASAVAAARQAKFSPTLLMGEPVKVNGVIVYNFGEPAN